MLKLVSVMALTLLSSAPILADGMPSHRYRHRHYLPPERHVVEVVQPPGSGNFIINGAHFTGRTRACLRWAAGERIKLLSGDWHGACVVAVFYNFNRRSRCETWCQ
jgi:hypothetical protein